jgi:hypothetical protein
MINTKLILASSPIEMEKKVSDFMNNGESKGILFMQYSTTVEQGIITQIEYSFLVVYENSSILKKSIL